MDPFKLLQGAAEPDYGSDATGDDGHDFTGFVENLSKKRSKKDSATPSAAVADPAKRRIRKQSQVMAPPESEFAALGSKTALSIESLMVGDKSIGSDAQASLKAVCKAASAAKPRAPTVVEERVTRKAAYEDRSSDMGKWSQTVQVNRAAETLDLRDKSRVANLSSASMVSKFAPTTDMEKEITRLLEGKGNKREVEAAEEAEMEGSLGLTEDQIKARRGELQKMKSLLFYEQQKRRRINKIKSKTYRRIRNRQKRRREGDEGSDAEGSLDEEAAAEAEEKEAVRRMQERMSLKHKNTSKWARQQLKLAGGGKGAVGAAARRAMGEQLRLGEELRKKAMRPDGEASNSESDSDSDGSEGGEGDAQSVVAAAKAKTEALILGMDKEASEEAAPAKGMMGMAFMKRAVSKQREAAKKEAQALLEQLAAGEQLETDDEDDAEEAKEEEEGANAGGGKAKALGGKAVREVPAPSMLGESLEVARRSQPTKQVKVEGNIALEAARSKQARAMDSGANPSAPPPTKAASASAPSAVPEENPWLDVAATSASRPKKSKAKTAASVVDLEKATAEVLRGTEHAVRGEKKKGAETPAGGAAPGQGGKRGKAKQASSGELSQAELVARAFAAPNLEKEFLDERAKEEGAREQPEVDASDGWGSWAGMGAPPPRPATQQARASAKLRKPTPEEAKAAAQLAAAKRKREERPLVVVSEKRIKAAARLKVDEVPYPFTSREQYERSLAVPVGKEWNGMRAARGFARPKLIADSGRAIKPVKLEKQRRQAKAR